MAEAGIPYKGHPVGLPPLGGWDTKTPAFLAVNPAGTVPVLVHNGHPVYESLEQLLYIVQHLADLSDSRLPALLPANTEQKEKMLKDLRERWELSMDDLFTTPAACLRRSPANTFFPMVVPLFCALIHRHVNFRLWLANLAWVPFLPVRSRKMVGLLTVVKLFGVSGLKKTGPLINVVKNVRRALDFHLAHLEVLLSAAEDPGPPKEYTLADIMWVPFLQRMEEARWWPEFDGKYPHVHAYWAAVKAREATKACLPGGAMLEQLLEAGRQLDSWKAEHSWLRQIYTD